MSDILESIRKADAQRQAKRGVVALVTSNHTKSTGTFTRNRKVIGNLALSALVASVIAISSYTIVAGKMDGTHIGLQQASTGILVEHDTCSGDQSCSPASGDLVEKRISRGGNLATERNRAKLPSLRQPPIRMAEQPSNSMDPDKADSESPPGKIPEESTTPPVTPVKPDEPATHPSAPMKRGETAIAYGRTTSSIPQPDRLTVKPATGYAEQTAYHKPLSANPLNNIQPPLAVEVQEFGAKGFAARPKPSPQTANTNDIPYLSTLSYQYQTMVPKLTINAQVYSSNRTERFVVINMKRYNEGQQTSEGVTVELIRSSDIVFSYQGQRFRLNR